MKSGEDQRCGFTTETPEESLLFLYLGPEFCGEYIHFCGRGSLSADVHRMVEG